jgi:hypothetical protein
MANLQNVWVRTVEQELIRADHIMSLVPATSGVGEGGVLVRVPGGRGQEIMREVIVLECPRELSVRAAGGLAIALGQASDHHDAPAVFVFAPGADHDRSSWQVSFHPPAD